MKKLAVFILFLLSRASYGEESPGEVAMLTITSPVHGVYITPNTPGSKVPSHGTTEFGEEYAIDFVMVPPEGTSKKPYTISLAGYLTRGAALGSFYGYGQPVHSPISGVVIACENDIAERDPANIFNDVAYAKKATKDFIERKGQSTIITGNYVLIRGEGTVHVLLAHLKTGSVSVRLGQKIARGEMIGQLGHSGNSTMPHLHMQFMDSPDYRIANGIPFVMQEYEVKTGTGWRLVTGGLPTDFEIVRFR